MAKVTGGEKLTAKLKAVGDKLKDLPEVRVGFFEGATYPDGASVPMVAAIQEFGAPKVGIPPRPFFRNMIAKHKNEWGPAIAALMKANDYDTNKSLNQLGEVIAGDLRQSIVDLTAPKLSDVTLMLRKMRRQNPNLVVNRTVVAEARARVAAGKSVGGVSTKPLIDTGFLLSRIGVEVK